MKKVEPQYMLADIERKNPFEDLQKYYRHQLVNKIYLALSGITSLIYLSFVGELNIEPVYHLLIFSFALSGLISAAELRYRWHLFGRFDKEISRVLRTEEGKKLEEIYQLNRPLIKFCAYYNPTTPKIKLSTAPEPPSEWEKKHRPFERYDELFREALELYKLAYISAGLATDEHRLHVSLIAESGRLRQRRVTEQALTLGETPDEWKRGLDELDNDITNFSQ